MAILDDMKDRWDKRQAELQAEREKLRRQHELEAAKSLQVERAKLEAEKVKAQERSPLERIGAGTVEKAKAAEKERARALEQQAEDEIRKPTELELTMNPQPAPSLVMPGANWVSGTTMRRSQALAQTPEREPAKQPPAPEIDLKQQQQQQREIAELQSPKPFANERLAALLDHAGVQEQAEVIKSRSAAARELEKLQREKDIGRDLYSDRTGGRKP